MELSVSYGEPARDQGSPRQLEHRLTFAFTEARVAKGKSHGVATGRLEKAADEAKRSSHESLEVRSVNLLEIRNAQLSLNP